MTARPSQSNVQAEVQEVLQPLLGSAQQTAPSTSSTPQSVANLEATGNGENSSQDNSTMTNESNSTENLEVFILSVFHLCIRFGFGGYFCWMLYFSFMYFLGPRKSVLNFALGGRAR